MQCREGKLRSVYMQGMCSVSAATFWDPTTATFDRAQTVIWALHDSFIFLSGMGECGETERLRRGDTMQVSRPGEAQKPGALARAAVFALQTMADPQQPLGSP